MIQLLPHRFKFLGAIIAPTSFLIWVGIQLGWYANVYSIFGLTNSYTLNVVITSISFFAFLFGMYALTFSREKIEDEMIIKVRLESFQIAAMFQFVFIISVFLLFALKIIVENEANMMLFFIVTLFIFWITYIVRFNYVVHREIKSYEE